MDPPPPYANVRPPPPLPPRSEDRGSALSSGPAGVLPYEDSPHEPRSPLYGDTEPSSRPGLIDSKLRLYSSSTDPRSSSAQSLVSPTPDPSHGGSRRTLLVVYIHGFYGNDQSFQSFPAHVHARLLSALGPSHSIHTKIYPRYKTYRAIEVARDNFSAWLEPHESLTTDVILVGHSMGGLLAADVVLVPSVDPNSPYPFKHRILGTISMDSPFLGLHPGIVVAGISSLFQPSPRSPEEGTMAPSTASPPSSRDATPSLGSHGTSPAESCAGLQPDRRGNDSFFNPSFFNDKPFVEQPFMKRMSHFVNKHKSEGLLGAVGNHITSHLEYGGCLADYPGLIHRYRKIRKLEDVDGTGPESSRDGHAQVPLARVRFVNYYTLSSGRAKGQQSASQGKRDQEQGCPASEATLRATSGQLEASSSSAPQLRSPSPAKEDDKADDSWSPSNVSVEESDEEEAYDDGNEAIPDLGTLSMQEIDPNPLEEEEEEEVGDVPPGPDSLSETSPRAATPTTTSAVSSSAPPHSQELPPLPQPPTKPDLPDLSQYTDKSARKQAEKESRLLQKSYEASLKAHAKAVRAREKHTAARDKEAAKQAARLDKEAMRAHRQREKDSKRRAKDEEAAAAARQREKTGKGAGGPKLRKFCTLPGNIDGQRDWTWVGVHMGPVDEVAAHCGLFAPGQHYEKLVADVADRIASWVHEDMPYRMAVALETS